MHRHVEHEIEEVFASVSVGHARPDSAVAYQAVAEKMRIFCERICGRLFFALKVPPFVKGGQGGFRLKHLKIPSITFTKGGL